MSKIIKIATDFSETPGLRYSSLSEFSAEDFYHEILNSAFEEAIEDKSKLTVDLDNTAGYTSSFLDEAFGNLVYDFSLERVKKMIEIQSKDEPYWISMLESETFNEWEKRRKSKREPRKTKEHAPWFRIEKNESEKKVWIKNV